MTFHKKHIEREPLTQDHVPGQVNDGERRWSFVRGPRWEGTYQKCIRDCDSNSHIVRGVECVADALNRWNLRSRFPKVKRYKEREKERQRLHIARQQQQKIWGRKGRGTYGVFPFPFPTSLKWQPEHRALCFLQFPAFLCLPWRWAHREQRQRGIRSKRNNWKERRNEMWSNFKVGAQRGQKREYGNKWLHRDPLFVPVFPL